MEVPAGNAGTIVEISVAQGISWVRGRSSANSIQRAFKVLIPLPSLPANKVRTGIPVAAKGSEPSEQARGGGQQVVQISVPDLGDIEEVEVIEVAATAGSQVAPGDLLVVLESDKASMEIPAEVSGVLLKLTWPLAIK